MSIGATWKWAVPSDKEKARRRRERERRVERERKALVVLGILKTTDAIVVVAGLKNCSQKLAREWLEKARRE